MADPLSVAASVTGLISLGIQVTQSLVDFYTAYKNQKSDVVHTTQKLNRLLDVLEILREQTDRTFEPDEHSLVHTIESYIQACDDYIKELRTENNKFEKRTDNTVKGAALTAARRVAYPFRQSTLQKLDEDIDETLAHLSLALQALQQKEIANVQDDIEDIKILLELVRADQISLKIRDWLQAPDTSVELNKACKKRHPTTGLWFVRGSSFSSWLERPNSFVWLHGFAGCGKSVLSSTAIQYAFRHRRSNPHIGIAFFFFVFDDDSKQDTSAMLRALILQLSSQLSDNHGLLSRLHNNYRNAIPPDQVLLDCLHQFVRTFKDVYIILDALDESPQDTHRGDMLQALADLRTWSEPGLHLLVTSRDELDIRDMLYNEFDDLQNEAISMKNDFVNEDIASFIAGSLRNDRRLRRWADYHDQIEKALVERAEGVCVFFSFI
jgi:ankyrin repeat domain-containing protein 50